MSWKNLSIGGKLATGFGSQLLLLAVISVFGWLSFGIVNTEIDNTKFLSDVKELVMQKEIDHLQWRDSVTALYTDVQKNFLDVPGR